MTGVGWDQEFAELKDTAMTEYYPGSKHPIIRHPNRVPDARTKATLAVHDDWDETPRVYRVNGKDMEFFTTGQLARALGREPVTIRKWEREGTIPLATFQVPGKNDDPRGRRRLYSREQVEGIVQIAAEEGMFTHRRKPLGQTQFKERVLELFKKTSQEN